MTDPGAIRGRGAVSNPAGRFETRRCPAQERIGPAAPETVVKAERVRRIVSRNRSPDIPFEQSINPARKCHCIKSNCAAFVNFALKMLSILLKFICYQSSVGVSEERNEPNAQTDARRTDEVGQRTETAQALVVL